MYGSANLQKVEKITVPKLRARKRSGPPLTGVAVHDFTMATLFDEAGVDFVVVGDSVAMVVQGLSSTIPVTLDEIRYHGRAVARATKRAHVVGDMPFMSFQASPAQAVQNAGKLMKDGAFESVKLEGGADVAEQVSRIVRAGIPVMGHIGLTPQAIHAVGGFRVQGKNAESVEKILADAKAIEEAGAYAIVLEAVLPDVAERVTEELSIPTIGIGAGRHCDGQVLVAADLLGLTRGHVPKFVRKFAELGDAVVSAAQRYIEDVQSREFPSSVHEYAKRAETH